MRIGRSWKVLQHCWRTYYHSTPRYGSKLAAFALRGHRALESWCQGRRNERERRCYDEAARLFLPKPPRRNFPFCLRISSARVQREGRAPIEFVYNVIAARQPVYEKTFATRVEFEADTMSMYFDQLPVLRARRMELLQETCEDYERGVQRYREALGATERMLAKTRAAKDKAEG